jgi:hypothetical protein
MSLRDDNSMVIAKFRRLHGPLLDVRWFGEGVGTGRDDSSVVAAALAASLEVGGKVYLPGAGPYHVSVTMPAGTQLVGDGNTVIEESSALVPAIIPASSCNIEGLLFSHCNVGVGTVGYAGVQFLSVRNSKFDNCNYGIRNSCAGLMCAQIDACQFSSCNQGITSDDGTVLNNLDVYHCNFLSPTDTETSYEISLGGFPTLDSTCIRIADCLFEGAAQSRARAMRIGGLSPNRFGTITLDSCHFSDWRDGSESGLELITNLSARNVSICNCDIVNNSGSVIVCSTGGSPTYLAVVNSHIASRRVGHGDLPFAGITDALGVSFLGSKVVTADNGASLSFGELAKVDWVGCDLVHALAS